MYHLWEASSVFTCVSDNVCCFFPFKFLCQGIIMFLSSKPTSVISASVVEGYSYLMTLLV